MFGVILNGYNIKPLYVMEKKTVRLITVSNFDAHTSRRFGNRNFYFILYFVMISTLYFMSQFVARKISKIFDS